MNKESGRYNENMIYVRIRELFGNYKTIFETFGQKRFGNFFGQSNN